MSRARIDIPQEEIAAFCERHGICRLSLFGSVLTDAFGPDSDVDVLVEFSEGTIVGFFDLATMEFELASLLDRRADMRTSADLSRYFREQVLQEAELQYAS